MAEADDAVSKNHGRSDRLHLRRPPQRPEGSFKWPSDKEPNDLFYSVAVAGLVRLNQANNHSADLNFPSEQVLQEASIGTYTKVFLQSIDDEGTTYVRFVAAEGSLLEFVANV
ncbi:hypothetical protein N7488_011386 [Penicillium malachiteum]|nr:hypothetical protein N7488_011386 [Penicillium malachiteum]